MFCWCNKIIILYFQLKCYPDIFESPELRPINQNKFIGDHNKKIIYSLVLDFPRKIYSINNDEVVNYYAKINVILISL